MFTAYNILLYTIIIIFFKRAALNIPESLYISALTVQLAARYGRCTALRSNALYLFFLCEFRFETSRVFLNSMLLKHHSFFPEIKFIHITEIKIFEENMSYVFFLAASTASYTHRKDQCLCCYSGGRLGVAHAPVRGSMPEEYSAFEVSFFCLFCTSFRCRETTA